MQGGPPGNHGGNDDRRDQRDHRGQEEQQLVGVGRDELFLEDQFDRVSNRLQKAPRASAVGPQAHLHAGQGLALIERQVGKAAQQNHQQHEAFDEPLDTQS